MVRFKLRIVVLADLNSKFGGGDFAVYKYFEYLSLRGHEVVCYYTSYPDFSNLMIILYVKRKYFLTINLREWEY